MRLTKKSGYHYYCYGIKEKENKNGLKRQYGNSITKLGQLEDIEDDLGIDLVLYCNVMKNQVVYIKGKEPEWADNGTKKDIVRYCVVRFTAEELVVRFNEDCSKHVITKPLKSYGKIWALTKEELK